LICLFTRSSGFVDRTFLPNAKRGLGEGEDVFGRLVRQRLGFGELTVEHAGDDIEMRADGFHVGLGDDGTARGATILPVPIGILLSPATVMGPV
jgi:hypothetical protein